MMMRFAVAGALALLATGAAPVTARPATGEPSGTIAFTHDPDDGTQVYTVEFPGGEVRRLTGATALEGANVGPRWAPDGARLAFSSDRDGDWDLYTMDPDGGNVFQLADRTGDQLSPAWSRDGRRVAFLERGPKKMRIHLMRSDGTYLRRLRARKLDVRGGLDWGPCRDILFYAVLDNPRDPEAYVVHPGTGRVRKVGDGNGDQRWNPSCKRITFSASYGPPESYSLFTHGRRGNRRRVVPTRWAKTYDRYHSDPGWSPDGRYLAYGFMDHQCFYCTELRVLDRKTGDDVTLVEADGVWFWGIDWRPSR